MRINNQIRELNNVYIINWITHAFWLALSNDLWENKDIDDVFIMENIWILFCHGSVQEYITDDTKTWLEHQWHVFFLTTFCWGLRVNKAGKLHESILYLFIPIFYSFLQVQSEQDQLQLQLLLRRQLQRRCRCSLVEELVEPWNRLMLQPWVGVLISGVCCFPEQAPLPFVPNFTFCHEEADIIFIEKKSANLSMCNENIS